MKRLLCSIVMVLLQGSIISLSMANEWRASISRTTAYSNAKSVLGGHVGLLHPAPYLPNIGVTLFRFDKRNQGAPDASDNHYTLSSSVRIITANLFYSIPLKLSRLSLIVGVGQGIVKAKTDVIPGMGNSTFGTKDTDDEESKVSELFAQLGIVLTQSLILQMGYHDIRVKQFDLIEDVKELVSGINNKPDLSGALTMIGAQWRF